MSNSLINKRIVAVIAAAASVFLLDGLRLWNI